MVQWPRRGSSTGGTVAREGLFQRWYRGQQRGSSTGGTEARKGFFHRWYSGQEGALPSLVQRPGKGSSTSGNGQEGALPSVVQRPGKGSTTGGTVGTEGLFHQWYSGQERALPSVVQSPDIETADVTLHPIVTQANPGQILPHFFNVHFNIILASTPRSSKWSSSLLVIQMRMITQNNIRVLQYLRLWAK